MSKPNFSHYSRVTPEMVLKAKERGTRVTDDMFAKALGEIRPSLLGKKEMVALYKEIDPKAERRGRRGKWHRSNEQLVECLQAIDREDVPAKFSQLLAERLVQGIRYTEFERAKRAHVRLTRITCGMFAAGLYADFRTQIISGTESVIHPILGKFEITNTDEPLRERALSVTSAALRKLGAINHISNGRLKNFISDYNTGKLHKKT